MMQTLLDVIRDAWVNLNSWDFGMEGVGDFGRVYNERTVWMH